MVFSASLVKRAGILKKKEFVKEILYGQDWTETVRGTSLFVHLERRAANQLRGSGARPMGRRRGAPQEL